MTKSCFTTHTQASNTQLPFETHIFTSYIQIICYTLLCNILIYSHAIHIELTDTDKYLPPDDPNITNLMVSHYDREKQHNLRQFSLPNVVDHVLKLFKHSTCQSQSQSLCYS